MIEKTEAGIPPPIVEVDAAQSSSSDTDIEECAKKRPRSGSFKKEQGAGSRRNSKQSKENQKAYSTTSGDDPDLESDAKTPKKFAKSKSKHKDSDFFASSDSDSKISSQGLDLKPVVEENQVSVFDKMIFKP